MSKVFVADYRGLYGPPGQKFYRDKTVEELDQDDLDAAQAAIDDENRRALMTPLEFRKLLEGMTWDPAKQGFSNPYQAITASDDPTVRALTIEALTEINLNRKSARFKYGIRNVLEVKGMPDGTAILTAAEGDAIIAIPAAG